MKNISLILLSWMMIPLTAANKRTSVNKHQLLSAIKVQGKYFIDDKDKKFIPWGFNYLPGGSLMEDNWYADTTWAMIKRNFKEMKDMNANIVRIHLDYNKFMLSPDKPNMKELNRLKQLVDYAEQIGIYLDVTGLACYRASDTPAWYDAMDETERWATQAIFWEAIAKKIGSNNAVMDYDLINEPTIPGDATDIWLPGKPYGPYNFVQNVTRTPKGRSFSTIMTAWIKQLTAGIRKYDKKTLITVGYLPLGNVAQFSSSLDYVSTHIYPEAGKIQQWVDFVNTNTSQNPKPLIIEEIYPLSAGVDDTKLFMKETKPMVAGYISHYFGHDITALQACPTKHCSIQLEWLKAFMGLYPNK